MQFSAGEKLGVFEILSILGVGGMGEVYRARDTKLGREVALKVLPQSALQKPERLARFAQEARAASALNHPNIVAIYEIGSVDSTNYIAMELVDGKTIHEMLEAGPIPVRKVLQIGGQVADGLAKAHAAGIIHRDLKPENVMINKDGFCKILDFGLAKLSASPSNESMSTIKTMTATEVGTILGTVGYMSPEQASGRAVDFRSDQFSLGVILYEMITGRRAFLRNSPVEILSAIINDEPEPVGNLSPQTAPPVRWIIERCMAKDPEDRYASTRDLAQDLQKLRDRISEIGTSTETVIAPPRKSFSKAAGVVLLMLICLGLGFSLAYFRLAGAMPEPPRFHYLTYSGHDAFPSASRDGKLVAFASNRDGISRIWLKELAAGNEVVLTSGPDYFPRFSPDGSSILFSRRNSTQTASDLYRVSVLGGEPRKVLDNVYFADWSPDGKRIVSATVKPNSFNVSALGISDNDGGNFKEIFRDGRLNMGPPRWSPDGKLIAFSAAPTGNVAVKTWVIGLDGKIQQQIAPRDGWGSLSDPIWNGSDELIYAQYEVVVNPTNVPARLMRHHLRTGKTQTLFWSLNLSGTLDVVSQGTLIAGVSGTRENLREVDLHPESSESKDHWLTRGNSADRQPAYSSEGEWIVFSSNRSGNLDLWRLSTKTGAILRLTDDPVEDWDPVFDGTGKRILWSSKRTGVFEIWMANSDGSGAKQITHDEVDAENPTISLDGQWVVYNSYNAQKRGVWKIHPDGSGAARLIEVNSELPEISPDGEYVLFHNLDTSKIQFVRMSDGKLVPFEISTAGAVRNVSPGRARWMPDGKAILFVGLNDTGKSGIVSQNFVPGTDTAGSQHVIFGFEPDFLTESLGISPDGKRLTVSGLEYLDNFMLAENVPGVVSPRK